MTKSSRSAKRHSVARKAASIVSETKRAQKTIARNVKATKEAAASVRKLFRDATGRFAAKPAPAPKVSSAKRVGKKQVSRQQPKSTKAPTKQSAPSSTPPKKRSLKQLAQKSSYKLRELPIKGRSFRDVALDLEDKADSLDKLKKDDEYFIATYFGNRTKVVYGNMGNLASKISEYARDNPAGGSVGGPGNEAIDSIRILKFKNTPTDYKIARKKMLDKRAEETKKVKKEASQIYGSVDKQTRKKRTATDYTKLLLKSNRELEKQLKKANKQLAALTKSASSPKGKGSSSPSKKAKPNNSRNSSKQSTRKPVASSKSVGQKSVSKKVIKRK